MRIFLGSSRESLEALDFVAALLEPIADIVRWDAPGVFTPGAYTFTRLVELASEVDAAILVFGEDDKVWYRGETTLRPRDNVLIEYGLFAGRLGNDRAIVCLHGNPGIASDLQGMTHIDIGEKKRNRASIELKKWAERLRKQRRSPSEQIKRSKSAAATIHQSFEAIHQIFYQSSEPPPEIRVRERRFVFTIDKTGDCRCVETRWQTVINQHHSMELIPVAGTSDVLGFDSLKEKAVLRGCGSSTVVVPALDDLREKRFLVYFVPAIPKGEEHELEISWTWPKMWKPLVAGRPDSWLVRPSSTWEIQRLLLVFDLERGLPDIVLRNVGQGGGKPVEEADIIPGRTGSKRFAWEIKSLRPGATVVMKLEPQTG